MDLTSLLALLPPTPHLIRLTYILVTTSSLLLASIPTLSTHLIAYGKSLPPPPSTSTSTSTSTTLPRLLHALTVPHHYFTHFYILGLIANLLCAQQIWSDGPVYRVLHASWGEGMSMQQVLVVWGMMVVQVGRRALECMCVMKKGEGSRMSLAHYIVGCGFYVGASVAVWCEGCDAIDAFNFTPGNIFGLMLSWPSLRTILGVWLFAVSSVVQYKVHKHLAGLVKYSLPTSWEFRWLVCPHYTAEVGVYLGMAVVAGRGWGVNGTLACVVAFVGVTLAEAGGVTREWYARKFGREWARVRWVIVPGVY